jgi:Zn finger protein HypA/HybF involved in hydrogenase expression
MAMTAMRLEVRCWRCDRVIGEKEPGTGRFILDCRRCGAKNVVELGAKDDRQELSS